MKKTIIIAALLFSINSFSQAHIGAMGGYNFESENTQVGVGLNYMLLPKVSVGAMAMVTPFEDGDDYMIMYNAKYKIGNFYLVGGLMDMNMADDSDMNMNMGMNMGMDTMMDETEPYFGIEYKPFKNRMLKVYYNHSDMMKSFGIMMPIFNLGKKMNHSMHMDH